MGSPGERERESEWNKIKEAGRMGFVPALICFLGLSGGLALYILDVKHMGGERCLARKDRCV
jgi:hypothetical protein